MNQLLTINQIKREVKVPDKHPLHLWFEAAKSAIGAMRDLPDSSFETMTQKLEYVRVIDNIGKAIATGKQL